MLQVDSLVSGYSSVPVLHGVSIRVDLGEFIAVVGPNGAGKSTLFKSISGMVDVFSGELTFDGTDLRTVKPCERAQLGIAHVPEGRQVFSTMTVKENLELGAFTMAGRRDWSRNIELIFEWFPVLKQRASQLAGTLSGGEQQMLAIGRGLAAAVLVVIGIMMVIAYSSDGSPPGSPQSNMARSERTLAANFAICGAGPRIDCVVDGDTFWYRGEKIRIADIDAPELSPPRCEVERIKGEAAKRRLRELLNAGPFSLTAGWRDEDRYGRKLRTVTHAGRSIGESLVAEGLARRWDGARRPWCE